jgi:hypothetical protein
MRVLIAASLEAHPRLRRLTQGFDADFVVSFGAGVEALLQNEYSQVVVDLLFADSRTLEFARFVKEHSPDTRVVCVNVVGRPLRRGSLHRATLALLDASLQALGYEGLVDLERRQPEGDRRARPRPMSDRRGGEPSASHA